MQYKSARNEFDKTLRQRERQYLASKREHISNMQTSNPKEFWNEIKKLGPGKNKQSANYVKMENGNISHDNADILKKWKKDFSQLLSEANGNYDDDFLHDIRIITGNWERDYSNLEAYLDRHGNQPEVQSVTDLNAEITIHEVNKTIRDAKSGKAVGFENVPNEVLKLKSLTPLLHKLFSVCFEHNLVPTTWYKTIIHPILKKGKDPATPSGIEELTLCQLLPSFLTGLSTQE